MIFKLKTCSNKYIKRGLICLSKKSVISKVYETLKNKILNCVYKPGELIFEKDIVNELGVSRTPVREALNILSGEGLVRIIPKKGIQVASLSVKKASQIYELRKVLEALSISQAIKHIKPSDIDYLSNLDRFLSESVDNSNVTDIFKRGMDIHLYIANLSGNEMLVKILKLLREESYRGYVYYLKQYMDSSSIEERVAMEKRLTGNHSKIVDSLRKGDEEEAIKHVRADLDTFSYFAKEL